jgi:hypothetical protein
MYVYLSQLHGVFGMCITWWLACKDMKAWAIAIQKLKVAEIHAWSPEWKPVIIIIIISINMCLGNCQQHNSHSTRRRQTIE